MEDIAMLEEASEIIENTLDVLEAITFKTNPYLLAGVGLVALSTGAALGYLVANKRLKTKYEELATSEIRSAREFYDARGARKPYSTPEEAVNELIPDPLEAVGMEMLRRYKGGSDVEADEAAPAEEPAKVEVETRNIFVDGHPLDEEDFDYETEISGRTEDFPYIIHADEFFENGDEFLTTTLTYYEGDDVLADEDDDPIEDVEDMIGTEHLLRFGHGSKQQHIVYICNRKRGYYYEIVRSTGKFAEEVLGFIEHSDRPRSRRFRNDDE